MEILFVFTNPSFGVTLSLSKRLQAMKQILRQAQDDKSQNKKIEANGGTNIREV